MVLTLICLITPRTGEVTVVDEIVQQAAEAANSLLVPEGLAADTWAKLTGIERFMLRMMDMETTGAAKLDNYQNFAKAFRVEDYSRVMGSMVSSSGLILRLISAIWNSFSKSEPARSPLRITQLPRRRA